MLDHPELVIVWDDERHRIAHVCSRHADARRSLADGEITADFRCPYQDGDCLMRNLLGKRDKVALRPLARQS